MVKSFLLVLKFKLFIVKMANGIPIYFFLSFFWVFFCFPKTKDAFYMLCYYFYYFHFSLLSMFDLVEYVGMMQQLRLLHQMDIWLLTMGGEIKKR